MRILHVIIDLAVGGAENTLLQMVMHPYSGAHDIQVISLTEIGELGREMASAGIPVYALNLSKRNPLSFLRLIKMISILRSSRPELVQTWMYHANVIGGLVAKLFRDIPIVWNIRQDISDVSWMRPSTRAIIHLGAWLARLLPHRIVSVAHKSVGSHANIGYPPEKFTVIPNGLDSDHFVPDGDARKDVRREFGLDGAARLIGYFARYHPMKDHRTFIEAAGIIHQHDPEVHFLLCGEGIEVGNLELSTQIKARGLERCVHLLGLRKDIPRLMAALNLYSISSLSETFSRSVGEAMSSGVPCVVTDVGDLAALVDETGMVVPPRDPAALARACITLLEKPLGEYAEMSAAARQRIREHYTPEEMVARYYKLYREVVELAAFVSMS